MLPFHLRAFDRRARKTGARCDGERPQPSWSGSNRIASRGDLGGCVKGHIVRRVLVCALMLLVVSLLSLPAMAQLNGFNIKADMGLQAGSQPPPDSLAESH